MRYFAEEIALDVIEKKILRVGVRKVQTVMIDDLRLLLEPSVPAGLANLFRDSLAQFVWQGSKTERRSLLPAVSTFDVISHSLVLDFEIRISDLV